MSLLSNLEECFTFGCGEQTYCIRGTSGGVTVSKLD